MKPRRAVPIRSFLAPLLLSILAMLVAGAVPHAQGLPDLLPAQEAGWARYVAAVEARHVRESEKGAGRFLVMDSLGGSSERREVLAGRPVIATMDPPSSSVTADLPGARIHHWRGAVLVPGTTVAQLVAALEAAPPRQPDILRARVLGRDAAGMHVFLRIRRAQVVTVVYDTEHRVQFQRIADGRARSASRAVRIVEIDDAGTPNERALASDDDHDYLWRLNAYWRYLDVPGGVIAECESVSLSRDVPFGLGMVAAPFIRRAAESSMRAALLALR